MAKPIDLKSQYRKPKQARSQKTFNDMLAFTEDYLRDHDVSELSLTDLADGLNVAVGSAYHFFPSTDALLLALADRILAGFAEMSEAVESQNAETWHEIWRRVSAGARDQYRASKPAMTLILGPACSWQIRLADSEGNVAIAAAVASSLRRAFDFSFADNLEELVLRGIVISDAFWRKSVEEHETITDDYWEISVDAAIAYLGKFIPERLPLRTSKAEQSSVAS